MGVTINKESTTTELLPLQMLSAEDTSTGKLKIMLVFQNILWILIRPEILSDVIQLGSNCLQSLSEVVRSDEA